MNVETGAISPLSDLSQAQRQSGEWVPVSDDLAAVAEAVKLEQLVVDLGKSKTAMKREHQLAELRKPGRR